MKNILVTGGTGFIGSHTAVLLLELNYNVIIIDNLVNSNYSVLQKIKDLGKNGNLYFFNKNLCDNIDRIFEEHEIDAVIHFAGLKSVNDSISNPLYYYENNLVSTINLLKTMQKYNCNHLIFSSSCTIYGSQTVPPVKETDNIGQNITNPYGETKYMLEKIMMDYCKSNLKCKIIALRYFNPIGAHPSGLIGENPNDKPNNLMPFILNTAFKNIDVDQDKVRSYLSIFGDNYETRDGTCIRDYIHVMDLARSHILGLQKLDKISGYHAINVGTGRGVSVLELVKIFEKVNGVKVPYKFMKRRSGDISQIYCISDKAKDLLNFKPFYDVEDMCKHAWNYKLKSMEF